MGDILLADGSMRWQRERAPRTCIESLTDIAEAFHVGNAIFLPT